MNILFVLENYYPHIGGVEVLFKNLAEGLVRSGNNITVVTHLINGTKKFEIINGVKIYRVPCFDSRYLFTFKSILLVIKLAKKADIIQTTTFNGAFPAWLASKITKKKSVITIHEVWVNKWKELTDMNRFSAFIHNCLEKLIYLIRFDKYIAVSKSTRNQLRGIGIPDKKISVVYNGVDYDLWNPQKYDKSLIRKNLCIDKDFVCVFSGRPGTSKGLEYLIKAIDIAKNKISKLKLLAIVSKDKSYKKKYKSINKLIDMLGLNDKVILHDPVKYKDLPKYIISADCVIVPSLAEGFGFAAAEACALNIPVVVSNITSLPEVVSGNFVLVKPKDSDSIAEGIIKVYNKQTIKKRLKRFKIEDNIKGYMNVYKEIKN